MYRLVDCENLRLEVTKLHIYLLTRTMRRAYLFNRAERPGEREQTVIVTAAGNHINPWTAVKEQQPEPRPLPGPSKKDPR